MIFYTNFTTENIMRKWVNIKVQQLTEDNYATSTLSSLDNVPSEYAVSSLCRYNYQGQKAKEFETYIQALLKREYAKNLSLMISNDTFIYCNNLADVFSFAYSFIETFKDVYALCSKPDMNNIGDSIKELINCYEENIKDSPDYKKKFEPIKNFLLKLPPKQKGAISICNSYSDQYAQYYANGLKILLSSLATIFNICLEQPKQTELNGFKEEISNTDKKRFNDWFDRFENEYEFNIPAIQTDFPLNNPHISIEVESFNNIKVHFKDVDFYAENTFCTINDLFLGLNYVRTFVFENCSFNFSFYESSRALFFKNCVFHNSFDYNSKLQNEYQTIANVLNFENCIFHSDVKITDTKEEISSSIVLNDCRFTDKASFHLSDITFLKSVLNNTIFEGNVLFENIHFTHINWNNLFFLNDFRNKNVALPRNSKIKQIVFGMKMVKVAHKSIRNFINILKDSKLEGYAQELEEFYLIDVGNTKTKEEFDIAIKSDWVNIKQAARILGLSYNTLLTMRKEDKATGIIRIPYIGDGKSTKYYYPLLIAYKSNDMALVKKLEKEMNAKNKC